MRRGRRWSVWALLLVTLALGAAACGGDEEGAPAEEEAPAQEVETEAVEEPAETEEEGEAAASEEPIVIGAAIDLTNQMSPFDTPALNAAQITADQINENGGVNGRPIEIRVRDTESDPELTKSAAIDLLNAGAHVLWTTCDVDLATPAAQEGINRGVLTVSPCIGTDQMGPKRFGEAGELAFSFGNVAQDEGAAMAEWAIAQGYETAVTITDNVIVYFQDIVRAFTQRFEAEGGEVVLAESFTTGDGTIQNVVSSVLGADADVIATTSFPDSMAAMTSGVRSGGGDTPFIASWAADGAFWTPEGLSGFNFVTYASVFGDDPSQEVQDLLAELESREQAPATGGFITGPAAVEGIASAIEQTGSTEGAALADAFLGFEGLETISGSVSFSEEFHSVFGREYRVMTVENGEHRFVEQITASEPATFE